LQQPISITALSSLSSLGCKQSEIWESYLKNKHLFTKRKSTDKIVPVSELNEDLLNQIENLRSSDTKYRNLDPSVLYAIFVARNAIAKANWEDETDFGINIGSSRGATSLFEEYHQHFLKNGHTETLTSPTTTLGNISSWVAHDLKSKGPEISHSITCSTALHAVLNGVAWLQSGMTDNANASVENLFE